MGRVYRLLLSVNKRLPRSGRVITVYNFLEGIIPNQPFAGRIRCVWIGCSGTTIKLLPFLCFQTESSDKSCGASRASWKPHNGALVLNCVLKERTIAALMNLCQDTTSSVPITSN